MIILALFVGLLVGGVFACDAWDASYYSSAEGRLVSATPVCRLRWTSGGRSPTTRYSEDMGCEEAGRARPWNMPRSTTIGT